MCKTVPLRENLFAKRILEMLNTLKLDGEAFLLTSPPCASFNIVQNSPIKNATPYLTGTFIADKISYDLK